MYHVGMVTTCPERCVLRKVEMDFNKKGPTSYETDFVEQIFLRRNACNFTKMMKAWADSS